MNKNLITFNFIQDFIPAGTGIRKPKQYSKLTPEGLVWHWTANTSKGAGAKTHRKYFAQPNVENGTHYVIDDTYVIQMVPDTELVWHSGPSRLYTDWLKRNFPKGANASWIGIELCVNSDGNFNKMYLNAVKFGALKCLEYNWTPEKNFYRHFDATGKDCPRFFTKFDTNGEAKWKQFKLDVQKEIDRIKKGVEKIMPVPNWAKKPAIEAIDNLASKGLLAKDTLDTHKTEDALGSGVEKYLFWMMLDRVINYLEKEGK